MQKLRKMIAWMIGITIAAAILYMGIGIWQILKAGPLTSFPWHTACYFAICYFGPAVLVELAVFMLIGRCSKRGAEE